MTTRQESKLSMYLAVKEFLAVNNTFTSTLPNFSVFNNAFNSAIGMIQNYGELQMFDKSGQKTSKQQLRHTLVMLAADTSRKIQAYATFANNQLLLTETKFSESELKSAADTTLRDNSQGIYNRAQANLTALTPYGVSAATQTTLLNAINAFVASIPKPRLATSDKKQSTLQLGNSFNAADGALKNIDILIETLKLTQPNFYNGYRNARRIVETGVSSLTVKGKVIDAASGNGIKNVMVTFTLTSNGNELKAKASKSNSAIVKKTADKGGFNVKTLPAGIYNVTISKNGYADKTETLAVTEGELNQLQVELEKK